MENYEEFCTEYGCRTIAKEIIPILKIEAKKEVFDDIEMLIGYTSINIRMGRLMELKKKHLQLPHKEGKK